MTKLSIRRYRPTERQRRQVQLLAAAGDSPEQIAAAMGLQLSILKKYFSDELRHGQARVRLETLESLATAARSGSAPAARRMREIVDRAVKAAKPPAHPGPDTRLKGRPGIDRPLSNKEQDILARWAHRDTIWQDLIDDPIGETEPEWCVAYRKWLAAQGGDTESDA